MGSDSTNHWEGLLLCRYQGIREGEKRARAQVSGNLIWRGEEARVPGAGRLIASVCVCVCAVLKERAAYGTSREGGLVEWGEWQGTVAPYGLMAGHSFLIFIFQSFQELQQIPGPANLDLQISGAP